MSDVSFKGTDAERTVAHRWNARMGFGGLCCRGWDRKRKLVLRRRIFADVLQKRRRPHEEQVSRDSAAEVEQPIIVAGRLPDEHVLEHLFGRAGRTAVAYEIGTKFALRRPPERHVVAQDFDLFPVLDDGSKRVVR